MAKKKKSKIASLDAANEMALLRRNAYARAEVLGKSMKEIAAKHDVNSSTIYGWLKGTGTQLSSVKKLALLLKIPIWELLRDEFDPCGYNLQGKPSSEKERSELEERRLWSGRELGAA